METQKWQMLNLKVALVMMMEGDYIKRKTFMEHQSDGNREIDQSETQDKKRNEKMIFRGRCRVYEEQWVSLWKQDPLYVESLEEKEDRV